MADPFPATRRSSGLASRPPECCGRGSHGMESVLPACLSEGGDRWKVAWRLVWHTTCDVHGCLLIDTVQCAIDTASTRSSPVTSRSVPLRLQHEVSDGTGRLGQACGHDLAATPAPTDADVGRRTLAFQAAVAPASAPMPEQRPPGIGRFGRRAAHRRWDGRRCSSRSAPVGQAGRRCAGARSGMGLLRRGRRGRHGEGRHGRHADPGRAAEGVVRRQPIPHRTGDPRRDGSMAITDRLRWRSMTTPGRPTSHGLKGREKARPLPAEALWADWAVRLTPATGVDAKSFRVVATAALLLPGTPRPLETVLRGTPHEGRGRKVFHVLAMVPPTDATAECSAPDRDCRWSRFARRRHRLPASTGTGRISRAVGGGGLGRDLWPRGHPQGRYPQAQQRPAVAP